MNVPHAFDKKRPTSPALARLGYGLTRIPKINASIRPACAVVSSGLGIYATTALYWTGSAATLPFAVAVSPVLLGVAASAALVSRPLSPAASLSRMEGPPPATATRSEPAKGASSPIVEMAGANVLICDADGTIVQASTCAERVLSIGGTPLVGSCISEIFGGLPISRLQELSRRPDDQEQDLWTIFRGGQLKTFKVRIRQWCDQSGNPHFAISAYEATAEIEIARELEANNARWLTALDGSGIGVFDVDLATGTSIVNDTWWRILGLIPDDDLNPQDVFLDLIHKDDLTTMQEADKACLAQNIPISINEVRVRHGSGKWIWLRTHASVYKRDASGRATRYIGTQFDVTQLKIAELELQESLETFRVAHQGAPVGIALIRTSGQFNKVNRALLALLGRSEADLLNQNFYDLAVAEDAAALKSMVDDSLRRKLSETSREFRFLRQNGKEIWVRVAMSTVQTRRRRRRMIVATFEDVSAARELELIKSEFVSTVSHELRTPLTAMRGGLGLLRASGITGSNEKLDRVLQIASNNCEHLIVLVNDILDMEKLASGKMEFSFAWFNLAELLREALDSNQSYAEQFEVAFEVPDLPRDVQILVDRGRFRQVLSNLLSNAVKFSPSNSKVSLRTETRDGSLLISVTDTGPGIPEDMQSRIFDRFSQIRPSHLDKQAGTGLGLDIARKIMDAHDGAIELESRPGKGATFRLVLPRPRVGSAAPGPAATHC